MTTIGKLSVVVALLLIAPTALAQGDDALRDEIMKYSVDPCLMDTAKRQKVTGMTTEDVFHTLKLMQMSNNEETVTAILPIVSSIPSLEDRLPLYAKFAGICIRSSRNAAEKNRR